MTNDPHPFGRWHPWSPQQVAHLFSTLTVPWWIAGGWAIDLFVGKQTRAHEDIDVQILRRDQQAIRALFPGWDIQGAHPDEPAEWPFREWKPGEILSPSVHDIWCRPSKTDPWVLQLMVGESSGEQWLFRRDPRIQRPLATIGRQTQEGIPYLAPEIQVLYKAKGRRPKDEADFFIALPHLDAEARRWLAQSLTLVHPGHAWLSLLTDPSSEKRAFPS